MNVSRRFPWVWFVLASVLSLPGISAQRDGFVNSGHHENLALLVGVANGLPGIGHDIDFMKEIVGHRAFGMEYEVIRDRDGTPENVAAALTELSLEVSGRGSLFFYYTGHGNTGSINTYQRSMRIGEIRDAIEAGITLMGPIKRLTLFFDSCKSGSLVDPLRNNEDFAQSVVDVFTEHRNSIRYWEELFVFASTRPNENCLAGSSGSQFTRAVHRAFEEVESQRGRVSEFVSKVQSYTQGSHPTFRFVPETLGDEPLVPVQE